MKIVIQILVFTSRVCRFDMWLERQCEDMLDLLEERNDVD